MGKNKNKSKSKSKQRQAAPKQPEGEEETMQPDQILEHMSQYGLTQIKGTNCFVPESDDSHAHSPVQAKADQDSTTQQLALAAIKLGNRQAFKIVMHDDTKENASEDPNWLLCQLNTIVHDWQNQYNLEMNLLFENPSSENQDENDLAMDEMEDESQLILRGYMQLAIDFVEIDGADANTSATVTVNHENDNAENIEATWTLLHQATSCGLIDLVHFVLNTNTVNVNQVDYSGRTPLVLAIDAGQIEIGQILLENGAKECMDTFFEAQRESEVHNALTFACVLGHVDFVNLLLEHGAHVNVMLPDTGDSPLHLACMVANLELVRILIDVPGIQLNQLNHLGQTVMFGCPNQAVLELLLQRGADPNLLDDDGETVLSMAEALEDHEIVEFLTTRL